jgi:hypothetical protein
MPLSYGGRDEKALQSRWQTDQRATSKDARAETPQRAKDHSKSPPTPAFCPLSPGPPGRGFLFAQSRSRVATEHVQVCKP